MSAVTATKDRGWIIALIPLGTLVLFFVAPMAYMAAVSVFKNDPAAFFKPAFVLDNYAKFFAPFYYSISLRSFVQAGLGAGIVTLLGFFTVLFVSDQSRWLQRFWVILLLSLLCLSEVVIAFALLILFSQSSGIPKLLAWLTLWDNPRSLYPSFRGDDGRLCHARFFHRDADAVSPKSAAATAPIEEAARRAWHRACAAVPSASRCPCFAPPYSPRLSPCSSTFLGVFVMPTMLGGPQNWNMTVIIQDRAVERFNMPLGAALAMIMLALTAVLAALLLWLNRQQRQAEGASP